MAINQQALQVYRRSELESIGDGCMHRYKSIWIDGVDDTSDVALIGIGFAAIKHAYIVRLLEKQLPQDHEEAQEAFVEGVGITKTPVRLIPELRALWFFHAEKFELELEKFIAAEERVTTELPHDPKRPPSAVSFAPDLVYGHPETNTLEIFDDKSGWHPPLTEVEVRNLFQARVNTRYARDRWPNWDLYRFTIHAVRFNAYTSVVFSQAELDQVDIEIRAAISVRQQCERDRKWPAVAGPACHFCELACPIVDQPVTLPKRVLTHVEAMRLAGVTLAAKPTLRAIDKALKGWCSTHGPLEVNGLVFDNRRQDTTTYPFLSVQEAIQALPKDQTTALAPGADVTIARSSLKGAFKQHPQLERLLAPSAITKPSYRFSARKPGVPELDANTETEENY